MLRTFEGVRFVSDKQIVVFDIGSAYTKYGYATESVPRGIIRTEVLCPETKVMRKVYDYRDTDDLHQLLVEFVHALFFRHVVISPRDARVVILESPLCQTLFRETLAKVLFKHFEIRSLLLLPAQLATISTLGINTALVLDVGYQEATLIPVYEGIVILKAWEALPLGGKIVHDFIIKELKESSPFMEIKEEIIEDIKVRTCFVTTMERSVKLGTEDAPTPPPAVKYPGIKTINVPGELREKAFEVFWERDDDNIPCMILDCLLKCPMLTRKALAENIVLIGGTTMAKGFASRLKSELQDLFNSPTYRERYNTKNLKFKFHTTPCKPNYTAWLGGAIFGSTDLPMRCLTKECYLKLNRVPDWSNLIDNQKEEPCLWRT